MYRPTHIASANPTVDNDFSEGYRIGNFWWNDSSGAMFLLEEDTVGAASWVGVTEIAYDWDDFVPTIQFTGGTTTPTIVARYATIGKTVEFKISANGTNIGTEITGFNITLPVAPKDQALYVPLGCFYNSGTTNPDLASTVIAYINCDSGYNTIKIYASTAISIGNGAAWMLSVSGSYEIA